MPSIDQIYLKLTSLLPKGEVWDDLPADSTLHQIVYAAAEELHRVHTRAEKIKSEAVPNTADELLKEWIDTVVPGDDCIDTSLLTLPEARLYMLEKLQRIGGSYVQLFIDLCIYAGETDPTIIEFAPFRTGFTPMTTELTNEDWAHVFVVENSRFRPSRHFIAGLNAMGDRLSEQTAEYVYFRSGLGVMGDRLVNWGNELMECLINANKPAHTYALFAYPDA